jgi:D-alanyl-lipoteichoic acid acyltransferase DltB (MBOAT superfamily)
VLFPTLTFGLFFLALFALVWIQTDNEWRKLLLLLGSWVFYGAWDWRFVALLIGSAAMNWFCAGRVAASRAVWSRRTWLTLGVCIDLGVLGFFKYYGFFLHEAQGVLGMLGLARDLPLLRVILPVGVSFFTFQGISYLVDVARGKLEPARLLDVMLLMSFFAHLVAGPIVRGSDLLPQFQDRPVLDRDAASRGLFLIVWGLFKKVVIASQLSTELVDPVFFDPTAYGAGDVLAAIYGYAVQIYCDFSAYSDMAIGLAALLGYRFAPNFDQPYRAASLQDFWRRWHISLSSWLRDYLYIPLGGGRGGTAFVCRNLMLTMVLGGLWHGASWNFVIWGALHGGALCVERLAKTFAPWLRPPQLVGMILTFHVVCLGWVFFRAESFDSAIRVLSMLAGGGWSVTLLTPFAALLIGLGLLMHWTPAGGLSGLARLAGRIPAPIYGLGLALAILFIDAQRPDGVAPFIYYQF